MLRTIPAPETGFSVGMTQKLPPLEAPYNGMTVNIGWTVFVPELSSSHFQCEFSRASTWRVRVAWWVVNRSSDSCMLSDIHIQPDWLEALLGVC